jgi:hypothetical protein
MQLVEQGKLQLEEPIGKLLPDLAAPQVLEGFDDKGEPKLRPAKGAITLRHLLTHTAGFTYDIWNTNTARYVKYAKLPEIITCKNDALKTPLAFDPGTAWEYGINIDFVGKAVEAVTSQSLDTYLREHIFAPLGMGDTGFLISPNQRARLVSVHARKPDGSLEPIVLELPQPPEFFMGGGGLYSTARDYLTFLQMLMHGGKFNGAQVLRPETVAMMSKNHIGSLNVEDDGSGLLARRRSIQAVPWPGFEMGLELPDQHQTGPWWLSHERLHKVALRGYKGPPSIERVSMRRTVILAALLVSAVARAEPVQLVCDGEMHLYLHKETTTTREFLSLTVDLQAGTVALGLSRPVPILKGWREDVTEFGGTPAHADTKGTGLTSFQIIRGEQLHHFRGILQSSPAAVLTL